MISFIIFVLALALFIYALLAGADFGAGVLEIFAKSIPREKRSHSVGKAMGPVWEANHIWLILALVISFNGFPKLFWFFSEYFHFPIGALAIGIIFRGASFTFLHYDPIKDKSQIFYHWIFGLSSLWCTMWIGIIIGSLMMGNFSLEDTGLWERYFAHWINPFSFAMGIFITLLMVFNAGLFLALENQADRNSWLKVTLKSFILLIVAGLVVHGIFYYASPERWKIFFLNPIGLSMIIISGLLLIPQYHLIKKGVRTASRVVAGAQLALIMGAGFLPIFPNFVLMRDLQSLDFYQTAAPESSLRYLTYALIFGCLFILPTYGLLMKIFKAQDKL